MGKEIIAIAEALSNERALPNSDRIFEALEVALATATRKKYPVDIAVRVSINRTDGSYRTFRCWTVVDSDGPLENPAAEVSLAAAQLDNPGIKPGDTVEEEIDSVSFDRITIQTAKQVLSQKVKDAEREHMIAEQRKRVGHVVTATVKKQNREIMVLDLGSNNAEAVLRREQIIPRETYGRGDRIKVLMQEIRSEPGKAPQIICTRTSPDFLRELFRIEVPEISEDIIEIMGVARDPGSRSKIAVRSKDRRIDPRGACIGMRGSRVTAVSDELAGEKIDVVLWDENLAQYVTNAMEPAEVSRIIINEDSHSISVAVAEGNLALAIGRNGQNVRLASQLIGWDLRVMSVQAMEEGLHAESDKIVRLFVDSLNIDEDFAVALNDAGFSNLEQVAFVPPEELRCIDGIDDEMIKALQENARTALDKHNREHNAEMVAELSALEGIDRDLAEKLIAKGIKSGEDLADQAVDDLTDIEGLDSGRAGKIIMAARNEYWFKPQSSVGAAKAAEAVPAQGSAAAACAAAAAGANAAAGSAAAGGNGGDTAAAGTGGGTTAEGTGGGTAASGAGGVAAAAGAGGVAAAAGAGSSAAAGAAAAEQHRELKAGPEQQGQEHRIESGPESATSGTGK